MHKDNIEKEYNAVVVEVHSGDDLVLLVDLDVENLYKKQRARLKRVDTPDAYKASGSTEAGKIRAEVSNLILGRECRAFVHSTKGKDWIVTLVLVTDAGTLNINEYLIDKGYGFNSSRITA